MPRATPDGERQAALDAPGGRVFWITNALGMGIMLFGVAGLLRHRDRTVPWDALTFLAGSLVAHDALFAPLVGLGSLLLVRIVPRRVRPVVQGTLVVSAAVVLISIPVLTGRGRNPNNPSILPGDYGPALLKVLAVVWAVGAVAALWTGLRRRMGEPGTPEHVAPEPPVACRHGW